MPDFLTATPPGQGFVGLGSIYQFVNEDGQNPDNVCGQAACATLLTYCGLMRAELATLREIEQNYPPDLFFGKLGTSPLHIQKILEHYGANNLQKANNIDALKQCVSSSFPVICLIQNTGGLFGLKDGAHWFVVFAYDDDGVFVTNYGIPCHLSWSDFKEKWDSPLATMASLDFKGITNASRT
jgi:Peptidase_C39 like family